MTFWWTADFIKKSEAIREGVWVAHCYVYFIFIIFQRKLKTESI